MGFIDFFRDEQPPLVEQAFRDVQEMIRNGRIMFEAATGCLLDNEILELDLHEVDEIINEREHNLRRVVLEHLTVDPNRELVFCLKLLSIVHEAERIGDLAKSLSKVAGLAERPRLNDLVQPLRTLRDEILSMFDRTREGFVEMDEQAARVLMMTHERIKKDTTDYIERVATAESLTSNEAVVYVLAARLMSRVSSHLANIGSTVVSPFDRIRSSPTWAEDERAANS